MPDPPVLAMVAALTYIVVNGLVAIVEYVLLHVRRRRFGEPRPAWKNEPIPPPYS